MKTKESSFKETLLDQIAEGIWQRGDKLPSERQLANEFSISRNTVRSALCRLEAKGIITTQPGSGYFLANTSAATPLRRAAQGEAYERIMARLEAAYLFLPNMVAMATPGMSEEILNRLQQCTVALSQAIFNKDIQEFKSQASDFFQLIAASTGNPIIEEVVSSFCASSSLMFPGFFSFDETEQKRLFADYVLIFNALKKHDTEEAVNAVKNKIINTCTAFSALKGVRLPHSIETARNSMVL